MKASHWCRQGHDGKRGLADIAFTVAADTEVELTGTNSWGLRLRRRTIVVRAFVTQTNATS